MRERIFKFDETNETLQAKYWAGTSLTYSEEIASRSSRSYHAMLDVVTPNFKSLSATGTVINNPMYRLSLEAVTERPIAQGNGVCSGRPDHWIWYLPDSYPDMDMVDCSLSDYFDPTPPQRYLKLWNQDKADLAITKAWSNVDQSELLALASLGEMRETVSWISSIYLRFGNIIKALKNRQFTQLKRNTRNMLENKKFETFSDYWMEFRYAFRPLVFEMQQAVNALNAIIDKNMRLTARGFERELVTSSDSYELPSGDTKSHYTTTLNISRNFRAGVLYNIDSNINGALAVWGLDQPLEAMWELTRLSFVVDWFLNIGDLVSAWSVNPNLSPITSWITEETDYNRITQCTSIYRNDSYGCGSSTKVEASSLGKCNIRVRAIRRTPCPSRTLMPQVKIKLNLAKTIDLALIGRQLFNALRAR